MAGTATDVDQVTGVWGLCPGISIATMTAWVPSVQYVDKAWSVVKEAMERASFDTGIPVGWMMLAALAFTAIYLYRRR